LSFHLEQRIGVRLPQLADDGRVEKVRFRVESPTVKRRLYVCCSTAIIGVCDSVRLLYFMC
jgi:hypothetical protein